MLAVRVGVRLARVPGFLPAILPNHSTGFFTSQSTRILPAGAMRFFQPECWGVTSQSAWICISWSAGVFYQPECWGFTSQSAGVFHQLECCGSSPARVLGFASQTAEVLPTIVLGSFTSRSARFLWYWWM